MNMPDTRDYTKHNINDLCRVKITMAGREVIEEERRRMRRLAPHMDWSALHEPDTDGYLRMQLHALMQLFGPSCSLGNPPPFLDCAIEIEEGVVEI
jgi:hypothetical protein